MFDGQGCRAVTAFPNTPVFVSDFSCSAYIVEAYPTMLTLHRILVRVVSITSWILILAAILEGILPRVVSLARLIALVVEIGRLNSLEKLF